MNSGASGVSRHYYMPFGEELGAGTGGRTAGMGFSNSGDNNRKKFTGYERDNETGLDFAQARYNSSTLGRFTSPDPFSGSMSPGDPQSFNRYAYVGNNPLTHTDPTGLHGEIAGGGSLPRDESALGRLTGENGVFSTESWKAAPTASSELEEEATKDAEVGGDDGKASDPQKTAGGPCDQTLTGIFGDPKTAIAAGSGYEPSNLPAAYPGARDRSQAFGDKPSGWGHLLGYSMHLYNLAAPGVKDTTIYIPTGFTLIQRPTGSDALALFHYDTLGNQHDVTLAVFHVHDFRIRPNVTNGKGSVRIGMTGGPGGETLNYRHSHFEVHKGWGLPTSKSRDPVTRSRETNALRDKTRVFFRNVFCP